MIFGGMSPILAHAARLARSEPANQAILSSPPVEVVLWFEEELLSDTSNLKVFDAAGARVDSGDGGLDLNDPDHVTMRVTLPPLADDVYTVDWTAKLVDGDVSFGQLQFAVGSGLTEAIWPDDVVPGTSANSSAGSWAIGGGLVVLFVLGMIGYRVWLLRSSENRG